MAKYKYQNNLVEALTFDEFVEVGKLLGANIVADMPWSFEFHGFPVTHENDDLYLIGVLHFRRGYMLTLYESGRLELVSMDKFEAKYIKV